MLPQFLARIFLLMIPWWATSTLASEGEHGEKPAAKEGKASEHSEGKSAKGEHGEGASKGEGGGHGGGGHGGGKEGEAAAPAGPPPRSSKYFPGEVTKFPEFTGTDLMTGEDFTYKPKEGRASMVIFVASWCEACQDVMPKLKSIAVKYNDLYTDVIYVFAHDTKADAAGFAKEHKLSGRILLASHDILKAFKNPELPTVYIGDRYTYMGNRYVKIDASKIDDLDHFMAQLTVL